MVKSRRVQPQVQDEPTVQLAMLFKEARLSQKLRIEQVAEYLSISNETASLYENGHKAIPLYHIYALANCLNVAPNRILSITK
jgi:transcriptional regulator with XRE-family HTH domain